MPTIFLNKNQYASNGGKEMVLTQTQYDNLSEQDKMNGMTYYICDADSDKNGDFQPIIYSTNEREVGVWCDGKPLYQKTVFPSISEINAHSFSDSDFADAEMIMIIDGYYTLTNDYLKVALNQYETSSYWCRAGFRNDKSIYLYVNGYSVTGSASITIRYTKTTDTPGSGSWTPGGVPALHYSTDEQIVGTWIDGSTIYERTHIFETEITNVSSTSWTDTGISNAGIDKMIGGAVGTNTDGTSYHFNISMNIDNNLKILGCRDGAVCQVKYLTFRYTKSAS